MSKTTLDYPNSMCQTVTRSKVKVVGVGGGNSRLWVALYFEVLTKLLFPFNRHPSVAIICFLIQQEGARISSHYNRTTVGRNRSKLRRTLVSLQQCTGWWFTRYTNGKRPAINVSLTQIPAVL